MPEKSKKKKATYEETEAVQNVDARNFPRKSTDKNKPTPWLDRPHRDSKAWTYSENRLLDQITTEIMCAWREDLVTMQQAYAQIVETYNQHKKTIDIMREEFPHLEAMLIRNRASLEDLPALQESIVNLTGHYCNLAKNAASSNDKLTYIENTIKEIFLEIRNINVRIIIKQDKEDNFNKDKQLWYKRIWKRKRKDLKA